MAVQITDDGSTLKIVTENATKYISKTSLSITVEGDYVIIVDDDRNQYKFLYSNVSSPSESSALNLANTIQGYLDSGALGGGSSEALQTTGNTKIDTLIKREFATQGFVFESGTTALTANSGTYYGALFPEDTVVASITLVGHSGDTLAGETMPKGFFLPGDITAITLTSGSVYLLKN